MFAALFAAAYPPVSSGVGGAYDNWTPTIPTPTMWCRTRGTSAVRSFRIRMRKDNYPPIYGVIDPASRKAVTDAIEAAGAGPRRLLPERDPDQVPASLRAPGPGCKTRMAVGGTAPTGTSLTTYTDDNPISTAEVFGEPVLTAHVQPGGVDPFFGPVTPNRSHASQQAGTGGGGSVSIMIPPALDYCPTWNFGSPIVSGL